MRLTCFSTFQQKCIIQTSITSHKITDAFTTNGRPPIEFWSHVKHASNANSLSNGIQGWADEKQLMHIPRTQKIGLHQTQTILDFLYCETTSLQIKSYSSIIHSRPSRNQNTQLRNTTSVPASLKN